MIRLFIASLPAWAVLGAALLFLGSPVLACENMVASFYGAESGNRTADGSYFDGSQLVAAHRTLKFGTRLKVTYRGKSVVVRVADRGPWIKGRGIDLSRAAAAKIGMVNAGVAVVCVTKVK